MADMVARFKDTRGVYRPLEVLNVSLFLQGLLIFLSHLQSLSSRKDSLSIDHEKGLLRATG